MSPARSKDDEHRFELATQLGKLQMAADIIVNISAQGSSGIPPRGHRGGGEGEKGAGSSIWKWSS